MSNPSEEYKCSFTGLELIYSPPKKPRGINMHRLTSADSTNRPRIIRSCSSSCFSLANSKLKWGDESHILLLWATSIWPIVIFRVLRSRGLFFFFLRRYWFILIHRYRHARLAAANTRQPPFVAVEKTVSSSVSAQLSFFPWQDRIELNLQPAGARETSLG